MIDDKEPKRIRKFIETHCHDTNAELIKVLDWEYDKVILPMYGTKDANGLRVIRQCFCFLPRRNGKSTLLATLLIYHLLFDKFKSDVYLVSNSIKQSEDATFDALRTIIDNSPSIRSKLKVLKTKGMIVHKEKRSKIAILSQDTRTLLGKNASLLAFDEIAFFRDRRVYTNLRGSQLNRKEPLLISITTASDNLQGIGKELYDYAVSVRDLKIEDPTFLPVIFQSDDEQDWENPEQWRKANPSLGHLFTEDDLAKLANEAKSAAMKRSEFKQFHLNLWQFRSEAWIPLAQWQNCKGKHPDLAKRKCYVGADMARTGDLAAICFAFPIDGKYHLTVHYFTPSHDIEARAQYDKVPYQQWADAGLLTLCEGNVIGDKDIRDFINAQAKLYKIEAIGFDPLYGESLFNQQLRYEDGFQVEQIRQTFVGMGPYCAAFERLVKDQKIVHEDHPMLNWNVSNAAIQHDSRDNIMIVKMAANKRLKIDGLSAAIMATGLATVAEDTTPQIYFGKAK